MKFSCSSDDFKLIETENMLSAKLNCIVCWNTLKKSSILHCTQTALYVIWDGVYLHTIISYITRYKPNGYLANRFKRIVATFLVIKVWTNYFQKQKQISQFGHYKLHSFFIQLVRKCLCFLLFPFYVNQEGTPFGEGKN